MFRALNKALTRLPGNAYSQRWGLNTTMTLVNSDGDLYLFRRRLIQTPWVAVYLHDIHGPDEDRNLHSHPFPFISLILRGAYVEKVAHPTGTSLGPVTLRQHGRFRVNAFPRGPRKVHTIIGAVKGTRTLVITGRRRDSWGFFVEGEGLVHWAEYLKRKGRTREGRKA